MNYIVLIYKHNKNLINVQNVLIKKAKDLVLIDYEVSYKQPKIKQKYQFKIWIPVEERKEITKEFC